MINIYEDKEKNVVFFEGPRGKKRFEIKREDKKKEPFIIKKDKFQREQKYWLIKRSAQVKNRFEAGNFERCIFLIEPGFKEIYQESPKSFSPRSYFVGAKFVSSEVASNVAFTAGSNFSGAIFTQPTYFNGAYFKEAANFENAVFAKELHFQNAQFLSSADFGEATFHEKVDFANSTFEKNAYFGESTFHKRVSFDRAGFSQKLDFWNSTLKNGVILTRIRRSNLFEVDFEEAKLDKVFYGDNTLKRDTSNQGSLAILKKFGIKK